MRYIFILTLSLFLMSCTSTTQSLWENSKYDEKIASFLISKDGATLAIIGNKYHYIIKLDNDLKNILTSTKRKLLTPSFHSFKVDADNNISGNYTLKYSRKENNEKWLKDNGFKNNARYKHLYTFSGTVNGKRYSTNKDINKSFNFNKPYYLKIEEPSSLLGSIGKMIATPIAVAADGVKTIAGVTALTAFTVIAVLNPKMFK